MPLRGPIIVSETTDRPWIVAEFRRYWRKAADLAGVPRTVRNADSSTGATKEDTKAQKKARAKQTDDLVLELETTTSH
jgi:hypothetical protein